VMRMTLTSLFLCLGLTACQSPGASVSELAIEKSTKNPSSRGLMRRSFLLRR